MQVAGPPAAFASIVAGVVAKNGFSGLVLATVIAGILLMIMGVFKLGSLIKFIPCTITTGFTTGIAITIVIGQLKDFFGASNKIANIIKTSDKRVIIIRMRSVPVIDATVIHSFESIIKTCRKKA